MFIDVRFLAGTFLPAALLITFGYVGCDHVLAMVVLTLAVGSVGCTMAGFNVNHLDIAPKFAGKTVCRLFPNDFSQFDKSLNSVAKEISRPVFLNLYGHSTRLSVASHFSHFDTTTRR